MEFVTDLHLHSKYSRAVSQDMILPTMARWAKLKGIDILTASDWTHPLWFREMKAQFIETAEGLYKLKENVIPNSFRDLKQESKEMLKQVQHDKGKEPLFLLSTEIASIYSEKGKLRRIHNLVFVPNLEIAEEVNKELQKRGCNLMSDGRPIVGISSKNLLELLLSVDERTMLVPCHIWTPHFGIYGSASGYDFLEEAFEDLSRYVYGIETGLSSDPEMNWQVEELKTRSILSFSDAHSPAKMGREATVFELEEASYENLKKAIMANSATPRSRIIYTIEFYPEEGKYHYSGHRNCGIVRGLEELKHDGDICPVCKRRLTEGVLFRVQQLSSEKLIGHVEQKKSPRGILWYTDKTRTHPPFVKLVPLLEIVAEALESTVASLKVKAAYESLCKELGSEIAVLLKVPIEDIQKQAGPKIAVGVEKVRGGGITIDPGYDGEYGKVKIWSEETKGTEGIKETEEEREQLGLF